MSRQLRERIERLERAFHVGGCTCGSGPGMVIHHGRLSEEEASAMRAQLDKQCPVHRRTAGGMLIQVAAGGTVLDGNRVTAGEGDQVRRGNGWRVDSRGRVHVDLPGPQRSSE